MFRNNNDEKLLTPEKAYGEETMGYLGMPTSATVEAGLIAIENLGSTIAPFGVPIVATGGVMHTVAASEANVPLHIAAHTTIKVGGIMVGAGLGAATVSQVANEATGISYSDDKSEDKNNHTIPFSKRRAAKYQDNLNTIKSIFDKMQSSKEDVQ